MARDKDPTPNFDPAENPNIEYVPYGEDPTIQWFMREGTDAATLLQQRLWDWEYARDDVTRDPYSVKKIQNMNTKKASLDQFLADNHIQRSIRERPPEE